MTTTSEPGHGGNGLSVTGPGGWGLRASGRDVIFLVILLAGLAANGWLLRDGLGAIREDLRGIREDHAAQRQNDQALVCILAVPADDRTEAFRSGDPCAWILASAAPRRRER